MSNLKVTYITRNANEYIFHFILILKNQKNHFEFQQKASMSQFLSGLEKPRYVYLCLSNVCISLVFG